VDAGVAQFRQIDEAVDLRVVGWRGIKGLQEPIGPSFGQIDTADAVSATLEGLDVRFDFRDDLGRRRRPDI
jgi:hypothetical protein